MTSFVRILATTSGVVLVAAACGYLFGVEAGLLVLVGFPVAVYLGVLLYGFLLGAQSTARSAPRAARLVSGSVERGVYALTGYRIRSTFQRIRQRWKDYK